MTGELTSSPMKRCKRCGESKPLDCFGKNRATVDGKFTWCKSCRRKRRIERLTAPDPIMPSFSVAIRPGHMVHVVGIPEDLSVDEAAKVRRILLAHAEPEEVA